MVDKNSDRRGFFSRIAKLGIAGGIGGLLLGRLGEKTLIPPVHAADIVIDGNNTGTGTTKLTTSGETAFWGESTKTSGFTQGTIGKCHSPDGVGVRGINEAITGDAVGVSGFSYSSTGMGVQGLAGTLTGRNYGVYGGSASVEGSGVGGYATATTGEATGVWGETDSSQGAGVFGGATANSGLTYGVYGRSDSANGTGVLGSCNSGTGVNGQSGNWIGVLGESYGPNAVPIVARGGVNQTANLQEWQNSAVTALSVIDKDGWMGIGASYPARQLHIRGNQAVSRMDRDVDSAAFIFVRTAPGDFGTVWKSFMFGADASGVNNGRFVIGDLGTAVSGVSTKRLVIDNTGRVGIGTETPAELLHVAGNVKASSFITGDIVLANGAKVTEEGEGFAFKNDAGEKIAVLDREGNLYVKGEVRSIKDL